MNSAPPYAPRLLPLRLPRVCVAVIGSDPNEMAEKAELLVRDNPFLEFRLDYLSKPGLAMPRIKRFMETHPGTVVIATCRRAASGGKFRGSIASQLDVLGKAAASGCQLVDVELQTASKCKPEQLQKLRTRAALILSFHDFRATKKLDETLEKMLAYPADFYKIVSTATTLADNVTMIKFLAREGDRHSLVGMCMGEQGIISRVLGVRAGSVFTFASAIAGEETAPGQVTAQELRNVYRIERVDVATRVYGVVGDPIAHSLSPAIMNAAFRRENVNAVYLALHAKTLKDLLTCVREIPIHGISVTMPYKEAILPHLDNTDSHTTKIGACNTVVRAQDGKLYGFNTDASGIVRPLGTSSEYLGRRPHPGDRRRRRRPRRRLWPQGTRIRSLHSEPHRCSRQEASSPGPGAHHQARRSEETGIRCHHQCHPGWDGQHSRDSAAGERDQCPLCL